MSIKTKDHTNGMATPIELKVDNLSPNDFIAYYKSHQHEIEEAMRQGAVKFNGIQIETQDNFQHIVDAISDKFMNYIDGNSPRTKLSGNVYTSTEYDQTQRITMHNELSYSAKWPNKLFFSCLKPAEQGGETLLADSREILRKMDQKIVEEVRKKGVLYIRNLHSGTGIGPSWQDTFETADKEQLENYCRSYGINFEWGKNGELRLKQYSKGIINHRITAEELWFNQIDQFHPIQLGEDMLETLTILYESAEEYPMYVTFGDGTAISQDMVQEISSTIDSLVMAPAWQKNELLIVDNEMIAHGRNPYLGTRKVVVAMCE